MSLDSGSNELFAAMHKPTSSKVTLDAICDWVPKLKAANPAPRIGFSYIIVWSGASREEHGLHENIHEIVMAAERARDHAFDYIAYKPILERQESGAEVMAPGKAEAEEQRVVARIRGEVERAKEVAGSPSTSTNPPTCACSRTAPGAASRPSRRSVTCRRFARC